MIKVVVQLPFEAFNSRLKTKPPEKEFFFVVDPVEIKRHRQTGQVRASSEPAPWRDLGGLEEDEDEDEDDEEEEETWEEGPALSARSLGCEDGGVHPIGFT